MDDPIGNPGVDVAASGLLPHVGDLPAFGGLRWNDDDDVLEVRRLTSATREQRAALTGAVEHLLAASAFTVAVRLVDAGTSDPAGAAQAKAVWDDRPSWAGEQAAHLTGTFYDQASETVVVHVAPEFDQAAVTPPTGAFPVELRIGVIRPY
ncbi:hypothetical protein [Jiangella endophytica]|uniref:hypothetical protein n=1 Tax=Jiangella endophytica TaxID=1623398 RepID=UPI000E35474F|nr:hypothetical protein [Jiangella endophytica]